MTRGSNLEVSGDMSNEHSESGDFSYEYIQSELIKGSDLNTPGDRIYGKI